MFSKLQLLCLLCLNLEEEEEKEEELMKKYATKTNTKKIYLV